MQITEIGLKNILADAEFNCRGRVTPLEVIDLVKDIEAHGLQQPIVVEKYPHKGYDYKIISGHRRFTAFQIMGRDTIPSIIKEEMPETEALLLNLGENIHRKDLNILQEAKAIQKLRKSGLTIQEIADDIGKNYSWVQVRLQLLDLHPDIQSAAGAGFINQNHVRELASLPDAKAQLEAAKKIKQAKMSGEKVPQIKKPKKDMFKRKERKKTEIEHMMSHIQDAIGNNFGTRCLAWAGGEISDFDLYRDIKQIADTKLLRYEMPKEAELIEG